MAICSEKKQEDLAWEESQRSVLNEGRRNKEGRLAINPNPNPNNTFRSKIAQAIEANELCYNCETGFHYMKQDND
ncbi:hypothetical protein [Desulfosporosinus sp. Sb-LF]|uniref:hypothetical protein n=1 Tax=Desulfosporosinus sp. Sb-LF TaxID=2560027 RepID=UPI00107F9999|nr:hypothetical protein [Desulfosporosinus sp. Sb-LF]TGE33211.1 hypothetical protein E4K68_06845 [Desulfosporosinus sp. Sb-LF]